MTDGTPEPPGPPGARECGWFGSSLELLEGLEVMELGVGLLAAAWFGAEAEPGCGKGCGKGCGDG
ncbi:hypothetical protein H5407_00935 [Mitsuaria sp. WAJ17]|uniref:hypothetical protein n=1 Tax=Mitsuaria sp. WAJ17 TaxID=2761452 RepID=UPI0015FED588|nr:hypothetical protein [Mitsuaria sp. WAJ17]MBB2483783.1 hypothetical protein [Mitsuaria sp. WAJ17]